MRSKHCGRQSRWHTRDVPHLTLLNSLAELHRCHAYLCPTFTLQNCGSCFMLCVLLKILATWHFLVHWPTSLAIRAGSQICSHIRSSFSIARLQLNYSVQLCPGAFILERRPQLVRSHSKNSKITRTAAVPALYPGCSLGYPMPSSLFDMPASEALVSHAGFPSCHLHAQYCWDLL